jgi:phytol kinase
MSPWLIIVLFLAALVSVMSLGQRLARQLGWPAESARKLVHLSMALACVPLPWLFREPWPVDLLAAVAIAGLIAVRVVPAMQARFGAALHGVGRASLGELFFPAGVALLFHLSGGQPSLYVAPVLALGIADAAAALAGGKHGCHVYRTTAGTKSWEGSVACFLCAWLCGMLSLFAFAGAPWERVVAVSFNLAVMAAFAEGVLAGGLDNLLMPVATFTLLKLQLTMPIENVLIRCALFPLVLGLMLVVQRRSSLNGGGVLLAVLFGYVAYALAGIDAFSLALLLLVCHLVQARGHLRAHGPDAVTAMTLVALGWIVARRLQWLEEPQVFLCFGYSLACAALMSADRVDRSNHSPVRRFAVPLIHGLLIYAAALAWRQRDLRSEASEWLALAAVPGIAMAGLIGLRRCAPRVPGTFSTRIVDLLFNCLFSPLPAVATLS